jgi:hypothetical protein
MTIRRTFHAEPEPAARAAESRNEAMGGSVESLLHRVDAHLAADRLWRAKELLRGAIGSGQVDPAVLERYGRLLDSVGERLEAGKYLLLSGERRPEYAPAIDVFLKRHARGGPDRLAAMFPAAIRARPYTELPQSTRTDLANAGVTEDVLAKARKRVGAPAHSRKNRLDWLAWVVGLSIASAFIVGTLNGIRVIVRFLRGLF